MKFRIGLAVCMVGITVSQIGAASKSETRKAEDQSAYKTGEKAGELLLQQWIQLAKKNIEKVIKISDEIVKVSRPYSSQINKSFLQGSLDCLKKKDIKNIAEKQKLDKHGCARVLTCYYCWESLVTGALASGMFDLEGSEMTEKEALERAAKEVYGVASPAVIADLRKSLEADSELADCTDLLDLVEDPNDDDDEDDED